MWKLLLREKGLDFASAAAKSVEAMDVDESEKAKIPKTGTIALGSTIQPKRSVDLDAMAFSQGSPYVEQEVQAPRWIL
jgi:pre-mRNA-splicing helicase BRR2